MARSVPLKAWLYYQWVCCSWIHSLPIKWLLFIPFKSCALCAYHRLEWHKLQWAAPKVQRTAKSWLTHPISDSPPTSVQGESQNHQMAQTRQNPWWKYHLTSVTAHNMPCASWKIEPMVSLHKNFNWLEPLTTVTQHGEKNFTGIWCWMYPGRFAFHY